ncbi:MAG: hypothetical protein WBI40_00865 [Methylococcaceae bacterium]
MATLSKKERSLIADVIFNQDFDFTAEEIRNQVFERFGLTFAVDLIEDVIEWLYKDNCVEYDRCDKTIDLFEVA